MEKRIKQTKMTLRKRVIFKKGSLKANISYDVGIARQYHRTEYYVAMAHDTRNIQKRMLAKRKYSTPRRDHVTKLMIQYKNKLEEKSRGVWKILRGIYIKNANAAFSNSPPINCHRITLVSSIPMLLLAYRKIRPNRGAMTKAWSLVPCPLLSLVPCPLSLVPCPLSLVPCPLSLVPCPLSLVP